MSLFSRRENYKKPNKPSEIISDKISIMLLKLTQKRFIPIILEIFKGNLSKDVSRRDLYYREHLAIAEIPQTLDKLFDDIFNYPVMQFGEINQKLFADLLSKIPVEYEKLEWFEKLDFVEFFVKEFMFNNELIDEFFNEVNETFERENSLYRITKIGFVKHTSQHELLELNELIKLIDGNERINKEYTNVIKNLFERKKPDPESAIADMIIVCEIFCDEIMGLDSDKNFNVYLNDLKEKKIIEEDFYNSIKPISDYANSLNACRHGGQANKITTFEKAKFVIVTLTSFLNMLHLSKQK